MANHTQEVDQTKQEVQTILDKLGDQITPKTREMVEEAILKMKVENLLPKDALGFTPQMMEVMYQQGYNFFKSGKYYEALPVFTVLRELDILDPRYTFAIAGCHHYSKEYEDAAANYILSSYLDPLNPLPCFHLYDCLMKTNYFISALLALQQALLLAERDPQYSQLKEKIKLELEHLKEFLKGYLKEKYEPSLEIS